MKSFISILIRIKFIQYSLSIHKRVVIDQGSYKSTAFFSMEPVMTIFGLKLLEVADLLTRNDEELKSKLPTNVMFAAYVTQKKAGETLRVESLTRLHDNVSDRETESAKWTDSEGSGSDSP